MEDIGLSILGEELLCSITSTTQPKGYWQKSLIKKVDEPNDAERGESREPKLKTDTA